MTAARTVTFRPLQLPPDVTGRLYLHSMPGRREEWAQFHAEAINCGIRGVVCLTDKAEIERKSPTYARALTGSFPFELLYFPISDFGIPENVDRFRALVGSVADRLRQGDCLLAHCGAGIGRTGMFASCLLISLGCSADQAGAAVRSAGSCPETDEQRQLVLRFAPRSSE